MLFRKLTYPRRISFARRTAVPTTRPIATTLLSVAQIYPNPDQPRRIFDPKELAELKASIRERGLINPIAVVQRGEHDYLIMAGERRYRAVCELGWTEIDARIWPLNTPGREVELLSLVENLQRLDLNAIEVAKGYRILTWPPRSAVRNRPLPAPWRCWKNRMRSKISWLARRFPPAISAICTALRTFRKESSSPNKPLWKGGAAGKPKSG
jgi:hypothetical protein